MLHMRQYRRRLFSGSPKWKPQKTGTCPGSVVIDWIKDQTSMKNKTWNTDKSRITLQSSVANKRNLSQAGVLILTFCFWKPNEECVSVIDQADYCSYKHDKDVANDDLRPYWQSARHFLSDASVCIDFDKILEDETCLQTLWLFSSSLIQILKLFIT